MNRAIHIPLPVTLYHLLGPGSVVALVPAEVPQRCHCTVVLPVNHVGRCIEQPVLHLEALCIVFVMGGVEINGIAMHVGCRIGSVFGLNNRQVDCLLCLRCRSRCRGSQYDSTK